MKKIILLLTLVISLFSFSASKSSKNTKRNSLLITGCVGTVSDKSFPKVFQPDMGAFGPSAPL